MTDRDNAQVLKILGCQMRYVCLTDAILAECRLILLKAEVSQPTADIHRRFLRNR